MTATEGESLVVLDWDELPGLKYWIFYREGPDVEFGNHDRTLVNVKPPYLVTDLLNDTQYAFTVTSSRGNSPVGPFSPSITSTPRLLSPSIPWKTDGIVFTSENLNSITFGNDTYVTVGNAATIFSATYDYAQAGGIDPGTGWVAPTVNPLSGSTNLTSIIFNGAEFIALGDDGTVTTSTDADTWVAETAISTPPVMNAIAQNAGTYVAVGNSGAIYTNASNNFSNPWELQSSGTVNDLYGVSYVNGTFIAVGATGTLLSSTDGINWVSQTSNSSDNLRQVAYGADNYVAVGDAGAIVSSPDTITWTAQTIPTTDSFRAIIFGVDSQFIAVGTAGTLAYSTTGLDGSWAVTNAGVIDLNSIVSNPVFIAVGAAGAYVSGK